MKNAGKGSSSQTGIAPIVVLLFIFVFLGLLLGIDYGFIAYMEECGDTSISECFSEKKPSEPTRPARNPTVIVANGNLSGGKYSVTISMNIPAEGGAVTGAFSGTCDGKITGTYNAGDGTIAGKAFGSCTPLVLPVPARGEFDGTVISQTHSVPLIGTGTAMGISKSGSVTLTY